MVTFPNLPSGACLILLPIPSSPAHLNAAPVTAPSAACRAVVNQRNSLLKPDLSVTVLHFPFGDLSRRRAAINCRDGQLSRIAIRSASQPRSTTTRPQSGWFQAVERRVMSHLFAEPQMMAAAAADVAAIRSTIGAANAAAVRGFGTELLTIRIDLDR